MIYSYSKRSPEQFCPIGDHEDFGKSHIFMFDPTECMYASVEDKEGISDKIEIITPGTIRTFSVPVGKQMLYQFTAMTSIY